MYVRRCLLLWGLCGIALTGATATLAAETDLQRLKYNHPGLVVDLGVGLWAWPVPCDADGDGDFDLIVACPDRPSNGVWLFENASGDTAQNKFPVFKAARKLSDAVHYVMPSYVNGAVRVMTPGNEYRDFVHQGLKDRVAVSTPQPIHVPRGNAAPNRSNKIRHNQWRLADYDGDGALDLIVGIEDWGDYGWDNAWDAQGHWKNGPLHGFVYWLRNTGSDADPNYAAAQRVETEQGPVDTYGCPTPNFADFDHDGDLDLLCGEFVDHFTYFENVGSRRAPRYAVGRRLRTTHDEPLAMDLQMIVPIAFDWDRDGDLDLVVGDEDGRVALVENTGTLGDDRTPRFLPPRYFQQQADDLKCGALATPVGWDWDGDGDWDLISGNTAGYLEWFENLSGPGVAVPRWAAPRRLAAGGKTFKVTAGPNGSIQGPAEAKWGYTTCSIADWNADGLPDVVFNSIWGQVQWLANIGTLHRPELSTPRPIEVEWEATAPKPAWTWWQPEGKTLVTQWRTTPVAADFNGDGLIDLAVLDTEGYLAFFERARRGDQLVLLAPRRAFVDAENQPLRLNERIAGGSGRRKLCRVDWDGDGQADWLFNASNAEFWRGLGPQASTWRWQRVGPIASQNIEGHDVSPTVVDFDGDGRLDFVGGAEDGRFYFLKNPHGAKP